MKNIVKLFVFCSLIFVSLISNGQTKLPDGRFKLLSTVIGNDTFPMVNLVGVTITHTLSSDEVERQKEFQRLKFDVIKTYPYAKLASQKLNFINQQVSAMSTEKEKKKFIKKTEDDLKSQFEKDLKHMSMKQGRILIKLIDRQTGNTSYSLVKELRGNLQAFFWQGMARLFGSNLKSEYDSQGEDYKIEFIVRQIELGPISAATL